ncbi:MAG TPA: hypothetical protein VFB63_02955 [Bryobacteraceae bacterium]|nr:hypothetical protein [Bryobacteraceae bacterium]
MKACGLACLLLAGCVAPPDKPPIPKPGSGIAEYREVVKHAHRAVADTVDSLQTIARDPNRSLADFDRTFDQLELNSVKARSRAEAIIARGQNYFDEWKEQLALTNKPSAQADYDRLYGHFTLIRERSSEVREEFRPFMANLRQFRASVDVTRRPAPDDIDGLTTSGQRVLKSLDSVSAALNNAEAELHAKR